MARQRFNAITGTATLFLLLWFTGIRTVHFESVEIQNTGNSITSGAACPLCDTPNCAVASPAVVVLAPLLAAYVVPEGHVISRLDTEEIAYRVRPPPSM